MLHLKKMVHKECADNAHVFVFLSTSNVFMGKTCFMINTHGGFNFLMNAQSQRGLQGGRNLASIACSTHRYMCYMYFHSLFTSVKYTSNSIYTIYTLQRSCLEKTQSVMVMRIRWPWCSTHQVAMMVIRFRVCARVGSSRLSKPSIMSHCRGLCSLYLDRY